MGSQLFEVDDVHKIGILDIRLLNLDRHLGNILVHKVGSRHRLIPVVVSHLL